VVAELTEAFPGVEIAVLPSSGGVFDVVVDGTLVFSKKQLRRHAEPGEITAAIRARAPAR
jgi:selT/selW/selH-like putative selenoprotein